MKGKFIFFILLIITISFCIGCAEKKKPKVRKPATDLYSTAEELFNKKDYEEAIPYYEDLRNSYPASQFAAIANLKIGHCYFLNKKYIEAIDAYENFKRLYPTHKEIPLVILRVGLSYYNQAPKAIDRDQTNLLEAVRNFNETIELFPDSSSAKEAKTYLDAAKKRIAKRIVYVGNFYFKRKKYEAALSRYKECATNYSGIGMDDEIYFRIAKTYYKLKKYNEAKTVANEIIKQFPDSNYKNDAQDLVDNLN